MVHTEIFDGNTLRKIANQLKTGTHSGDVWKDELQTSLQVRVGRASASWSFKTRDSQFKIADFNVFRKDDIDALRELVVECKRAEKDGRDIEKLIAAFVEVRGVREAVAEAECDDGLGMRWIEARDKFLTWVMDNRGKDTHRTYRSSLGAAKNSVYADIYEDIARKPIRLITTSDLAIIRSKINHRGKSGEAKGRSISQADHIVAALKSAWLYFVNEPLIFGTDISNVAADLKKVRDRVERVESSSGETERALNQLELGMLFDDLGNESNEMVRSVLALQLLTGQRRLDVASAVRSSFVVNGDQMIWRLEDKVHAWRVLPLPPLARRIVENALEDYADYNSKYLFPKNRKQKKGDAPEGHISERTVSKGLERMRNKGRVFHFSVLNPSTHDLRKAFVSYMAPRMHKYWVEGRQLTREDIEMITHLDEGRETTATLVYDLSAYLDVKLQILSEWEDYVCTGVALWEEACRQRDRKAA